MAWPADPHATDEAGAAYLIGFPDIVVRWPRQASTHGISNYRNEGTEMFSTFPNNRVENRSYKVFVAPGQRTCSIARFARTMTGPMTDPDANEIPPTGMSFEIELCTLARWHETEQIIEENLFYDLGGLMMQIGLK